MVVRSANEPPEEKTVRNSYYLTICMSIASLPLAGCGRATDTSSNPATASKPEKAQVEKQSTDSDLSVVEVEGVGINADEALADAFRNAVRQVVGAIVDAETVTKNDDIISDKVLTYSDGIVKKYEQLSLKVDRKLTRVRVRAVVERHAVIERLTSANVTVRDVDTSKIVEEIEAFKAEKLSKQDARKRASELLNHVFTNLPEKLLEARVVGAIQKEESTGEMARVTIDVQFEINRKAYHSFLNRIDRTLKAISVRRGEFTVIGKNVHGTYDVGTYDVVKQNSDSPTLPRASPEEEVILLNTHRTQSNDRTEWNQYIINADTQALDRECSKGFTVKLTLLDKDGGLVAVDRFNAGAASDWGFASFKLSPIVRSIGVSGHGPAFSSPCYLISPYFIGEYERGRVTGMKKYCPSVVVQRTIPLTLGEIKKLAKVQCELLPDGK
jgi:hypothetical protein